MLHELALKDNARDRRPVADVVIGQAQRRHSLRSEQIQILDHTTHCLQHIRSIIDEMPMSLASRMNRCDNVRQDATACHACGPL
jgi:hypothetical protein